MIGLKRKNFLSRLNLSIILILILIFFVSCGNQEKSPSSLSGLLGRVNNPTFSFPEGAYDIPIDLEIFTTTEGATIYYTLDGSEPTVDSFPYLTPISLNTSEVTTEIRAFAVKEGLVDSGVSSGTYTINFRQVGSIRFTPEEGSYNKEIEVVMACNTILASIYYTLDGTEPTQDSILYDEDSPLLLNVPGQITTFRARAFKEGLKPSAIKAATYEIDFGQVQGVTFSVSPEGIYQDPIKVFLACSTPGAFIYYTIDGQEPTIHSNLYRNSIEIVAPTTLKARAFKTDLSPSEISTAVYQFDYVNLQPPIFSLQEGNYSSSQNLKLSSSEKTDFNIYYTLDGTEPTQEDNLYIEESLINIEDASPNFTTVKAKSFPKDGNNNRDPSFTITRIYGIFSGLVQWLTGGVVERKNWLDNMGLKSRPLQEGRCYLFDGTNDYVSLPIGLNYVFSSSFSISFMIKPTDGFPESKQTIFGLNDSSTSSIIKLELLTSGKLTFTYQNQSMTTNSAVFTDGPNDYKRIFLTVSESEAEIYVNEGESAVERTGTVTVDRAFQSDKNLYLGAFNNNDGNFENFYQGSLFDFRVYNFILEEEAREKIYKYETLDLGEGQFLQAWYRADEQFGETAYDSSGNGYHGDINHNENDDFHATQTADISSSEIGYSWHNRIGYNLVDGVYIPLQNEEAVSDVAGNQIVDSSYVGQAKYNAKLIESNCATFNGESDYINVETLDLTGLDETTENPDDTLNDTLAVTGWFKLEDIEVSEKKTIFSLENHSFSLFVEESGGSIYLKSRLVANGGTGVLDYQIQKSVWYHFIAQYIYAEKSTEDGVFSLYVDGVKKDFSTSIRTKSSSLSDTGICLGATKEQGSGEYEYSSFFKGNLADFRIYNKQLTDDEIKAIYQKGDLLTDNLLLALPLAEGAGEIVFDISGQLDVNGKKRSANLAETVENLDGFWNSKQDQFHYNLKYGCSKNMFFNGTSTFVNIDNALGGTNEHLNYSSYNSTIELEIFPFFSSEDNSPYTIFSLGDKEDKDNNYFSISITNLTNVGRVIKVEIQVKYNEGDTSFLNVYMTNPLKDDFFEKWSTITLEHHEYEDQGESKVEVILKIDGEKENTNQVDKFLWFNEIVDLDTGRIGALVKGSTVSNYFKGLIRNIKIYKNYERLPSENPLICHWLGSGKEDSDWADTSGNNLDGTVENGFTIYLPKNISLDDNKDIGGSDLLNPAGSWHNNSETKFQQSLAPALIKADLGDGQNFWFNTSNQANEKGFSDLSVEFSNKIFINTSEPNKKSNLFLYSEEHTSALPEN